MMSDYAELRAAVKGRIGFDGLIRDGLAVSGCRMEKEWGVHIARCYKDIDALLRERDELKAEVDRCHTSQHCNDLITELQSSREHVLHLEGLLADHRRREERMRSLEGMPLDECVMRQVRAEDEVKALRAKLEAAPRCDSVDVRAIIQQAVSEYMRRGVPETASAHEVRFREERKCREELERRVNELVEENRRSRLEVK